MNRLVTAIAAALVVLLPILLFPTGSSGSHALPFPADHYLCWEAADLTVPPQNPGPVNLIDQFEQAPYDPTPADRFCNPADKGGTGIDDPLIHQKRYPIVRAAPGHVRRARVQVINQFEIVNLVTVNPTHLMVPTSKNAPPPIGVEPGFEHYKCYTVLHAFHTRTVNVTDQFFSGDVVLRARSRLCNPVDKNAEGIRNPDRHLVCYRIQPVGIAPPVVALNQFGLEQLRLGSAVELCVPSLKRRI